MFNHVKIIGLSVGLLVILSGLANVSFADALPRLSSAAAIISQR